MEKKIKVVVTDFIESDLEWEKNIFKNTNVSLFDHQLKFAKFEELLAVTRDAEIIVVNMAQIDSKLISNLDNCKLIIRHGIGYDNVDVEAATTKGIVVVNIPDYCVSEVAEQTIMLIMACQRKLFIQKQIIIDSSEQGKWFFDPIYPVFRLTGKTIGIVGFGRIGSTVFKMLNGFGVNFLIFDPYLSEEKKDLYKIDTCSFEELLTKSDVITIHCPLKWKETYHLFDTDEFELMKQSAILINTARGGIVNLESLNTALENGKLSHAGIDVFVDEPPPSNLSILKNKNAICTPHLSWLSEESGWTIREKIVEEINRFLDGKPPKNPLNPEIIKK